LTLNINWGDILFVIALGKRLGSRKTKLLGSLFLISPIIGLNTGSGSAFAGIGTNPPETAIARLNVKLKSDLYFMSFSASYLTL
jgi:hypothetical protein